MGGVLAIDHGERKSGFASADALRISVQPLGVVRLPGEGEELLGHVERLVGERDVSTLLVGLPLHAGGREGDRARAVRAFARRLGERFPALETVLHDERLTTKAAEELLREAGYRGRAAARHKDAWSAMVLLADWIAAGEPRGGAR